MVVSNREPIQVRREESTLRLEKTMGGLVSALDPVLQSSGGLWICWDGSSDPNQSLDDLCRLAELNNIDLPYRIRSVKLTAEEVERYYFGFSNRQIWPLFHYFPSRYAFDEQDWEHYNVVNQKFARAVVENSGESDLVWIQDYHLTRVPHYVRAMRPEANLGFFCHIPFPHYEVFRMLPTRRELLEGMLGSDLIGFHVPSYVRYFMDCAEKLLPDKVRITGENTLLYESRKIHVQAFPISIDFDTIDHLARSPQTADIVAQLHQQFHGVEYIGLGVDRLDYTKGILERLECIALFFKRYPQYRKRLVFVQIAVPSRVEVLEYQKMKQDIDEAVGRINGQLSEDGWVPIHYLYRGFPLEELVAYYQVANFALVNPLRDGMNLVAKEYCAAQTQAQGALILSEMTGAAYQLKESFLVNPYDQPGVVEAIYAALNTPAPERAQRMTRLRENIQHQNIDHWLQEFVYGLTHALHERHLV